MSDLIARIVELECPIRAPNSMSDWPFKALQHAMPGGLITPLLQTPCGVDQDVVLSYTVVFDRDMKLYTWTKANILVRDGPDNRCF